MGKISSLHIHEGTALYSLRHARFIEVAVRGYFAAFGHRFLVVRDPYVEGYHTVIEEQTGRRICKEFRYRSVGAAYDRSLGVIIENKDILNFKVELAVGLTRRCLTQRNRCMISPAISSLLWK